MGPQKLSFLKEAKEESFNLSIKSPHAISLLDGSSAYRRAENYDNFY